MDEDWTPIVAATMSAVLVLLAQAYELQLLQCRWFTAALALGALVFVAWVVNGCLE